MGPKSKYELDTWQQPHTYKVYTLQVRKVFLTII